VDQRSLLAEVGNERTVKVRALPIGIPYDKFRQMALSAPRIVHERQFDTILESIAWTTRKAWSSE
jgi:trehalose-6-phosphate synthase